MSQPTPQPTSQPKSPATLVIGTKSLSSWSMRPWLALRHAGLPFEEDLIAFGRPDTTARIRAHGPAGLVPVLKDGALVVWDSLAICEYAAERAQHAGLWPADADTRAVARSVSAEMHSGFAALRRQLPMNLREDRRGSTWDADAQRDIDRVLALWSDCRARFGTGGDFLFGAFTIADCMYAPVVTRFRTYGVALPPEAERYADAVLAHPAVKAWYADALAEA